MIHQSSRTIVVTGASRGLGVGRPYTNSTSAVVLIAISLNGYDS